MSELAKSIQNLLSEDSIKDRFSKMLGDNAPAFMSSVTSVVNQNSLLKVADPDTILTAALTAASLNLSIDPNLGFAYIIPYNINTKTEKGWEKKTVAQFQIGYKGFVQLAQRTGLYRKINAIPVYQNQFKGFNALTEEFESDFTIDGQGDVIGYVAFFQLKNGFEKLLYATYDQVHRHAKKYSKSYDNKKSLWQDDTGGRDAMGVKTVLKAILTKYGPLSIDLQHAIKADQSVQTEEGQFEYMDNPTKEIDIAKTEKSKEAKRLETYIEKATTVEEMEKVESYVDNYGMRPQYEHKLNELTNGVSQNAA